MRAKPFNVKKAKKQLDVLWSKAIRQRDLLCRKCKKAQSSQAAHIFTRNNLSTRWDLENGWGSCYYCHIIWSHREPIEFAEWIKQDIGVRRYNALWKKSHSLVLFDEKKHEKMQ